MAINTNYNNYATDSMYNTLLTSQQLKYAGKYAYDYEYGTNKANNLTQEAQTFLTDSKSAATDLLDALNALMDGSDDLYNKKSADSSNTDVLSVLSAETTSQGVVDVMVEQLALAQKNQGNKMQASSKDFSTGTHQFEIEIDGKIHQFSVRVGSTDTNEDVQNKIAEAINDKGIGVNATVTTDHANRSVLTLMASETGTTKEGWQRFDIRDVSGDLISTTGVDQIKQYAQDAIYTENGIEKTSKSNDVALDNGVTVRMKKVSDEEVTISPKKDSTSIVNKMRDMVNAYNSLLEAASKNDYDKRTERLMKRLTGNAKTYESALEKIGISFNKGGYMKIDDDKMTEAAENGNLQNFIQGETKGMSYGFANRLSQIAQQVEKDPSRFISNTSFTTVENISYYDMTSYLLNYDYSSSKATDTEKKNYEYYEYLKATQNATNTGLLFDTNY